MPIAFQTPESAKEVPSGLRRSRAEPGGHYLFQRHQQRCPESPKVRSEPPTSVRICGITVAWNGSAVSGERRDIVGHLPEHLEAAPGFEPRYGALQAEKRRSLGFAEVQKAQVRIHICPRPFSPIQGVPRYNDGQSSCCLSPTSLCTQRVDYPIGRRRLRRSIPNARCHHDLYQMTPPPAAPSSVESLASRRAP